MQFTSEAVLQRYTTDSWVFWVTEKTKNIRQPNCKSTKTNFLRIMSNSLENTYIKKNDTTGLKESMIA